jgi:hypothetical protein
MYSDFKETNHALAIHLLPGIQYFAGWGRGGTDAKLFSVLLMKRAS